MSADLAQALDQPRLAVQRLETAQRLGLTEAPDLRRLVELYLFLGQPAEIPRLLAAAPELGKDADFFPRILEALLDLGETDLAVSVLGQQTLAPGARADRIHARFLLADNKAAEAARRLDESLREHPVDPDTLRLAGEAWQAAGNPDEAILRFARLARQPGQAAQGLWRQGLVEAQRGNLQEAVTLLEAARRHQDLPGLSETLDRLRALR